MKKINKTRYLAVFSIVTFIFLGGVILGQIISENKVSEIVKTQKELRTYLLSLDLQTVLASEYICDIDIFELTEEKTNLGQEIEFLEEKLGKDNSDIIGLKQEYSLLSIRQWLLLERAKKECNKKLITIIFFYSNKENASISESQGYILDYLYKEKYPKHLVIYALDVNIDDPALNTLKTIYGVTRAPSVVIDGKLYDGFIEKDELESIINEKLSE